MLSKNIEVVYTMKENIKKVSAIGMSVLIGGLALAGCTPVKEKIEPTQVDTIDYKAQLKELETQLENKIVIDEDNYKQIQEEFEMVTQEKEQYQKEIEQIKAEYEAEKKIIEQEVILNACSEKIEKTLDKSLATTISNRDLDKLFDGKIKFDSNNYRVEEKLFLSDALKVGLSSTDEEFKADPYLIMNGSGAIEYKYIFKDTIDMTKITTSKPLTVKFLGKEIEITDIDADGMTIREGNEKLVTNDDEFVINGKTVKIIVISRDKIGVEVDGEFGTIDEGDSRKINDIDILVKEVIASAKESSPDYATLIVGTNAEKTIDVGEEYTEDEDNWVYTIETSGDDLKSIGIKWDVIVDNLDDDYKPVAVGESIILPENYIELKFDSLKYDDYKRITTDFNTFGNDNVNTIRLTADEEIFYTNGEWIDRVQYDGTYAYYKQDGDEYKILDTIKIVNSDKEYTYLGTTKKDAETTEVVFNGTNIGNNEYDYMTEEGMIIKNTESNGNKDRVIFEIPSDDVEAVICIN
jgi:hypothetical protein